MRFLRHFQRILPRFFQARELRFMGCRRAVTKGFLSSFPRHETPPGLAPTFMHPSTHVADVERVEFLPCLYRDAQGHIQEIPFPKKEPNRNGLSADLYAASYSIVKGVFGPPRVRNLEITIFNTPAYQPDPALEGETKERLMHTIVEKEGPALVEESGGLDALRARIAVDTWWE